MQKIGWGTKINYGIGTVGRSMGYSLYNGLISVYFLTVLKLNPGFLAVMMFAARLFDGVNDLFMGMIVDNTKSKLGKFRPWIIIGAISNAIVLIALFWVPGNMEGVGLYIYATTAYILFDLTYTMNDVGYWSMIPAMSLDSRERDSISMIPRIFGGATGIITSFNLQILNKLGGQTANGGYLKYAILIAGVYMLTAVYSGITVKERVEPPKGAKEKFSLRDTFHVLKNNDQTMTIVVIMILFNLACNLSNGASVFYFKFALQREDFYAYYSILMGASQAIGLLGYPFFSKWFGRDRVYWVSMLMPFAGYIVMNIVNILFNNAFVPFMVSAFIMMAGYGSMSVMQNVMLADSVDYGEYNTGTRNEGIIFSMLTLLSKLASAFKELIIMLSFAIVGFDGDSAFSANNTQIFTIKMLMFMLPPLILVLTMLVYKRKFKLSQPFMQQISQEILQRRAETGEPQPAQETT